MSTLREFKEFALKGNVIDLAVAIVIGAAFTKIVTVLAEAVIMPLVSKALPTGSYVTWAPGGVKLGLLLAAVVDFFLIALALFIVVSFLRRKRMI